MNNKYYNKYYIILLNIYIKSIIFKYSAYIYIKVWESNKVLFKIFIYYECIIIYEHLLNSNWKKIFFKFTWPLFKIVISLYWYNIYQYIVSYIKLDNNK